MYEPRNVCIDSLSPQFKSSNWKAKLTERCRKRIKEGRENLFNSSRNLPNKEELTAFVMETVQGQWNELKNSNEMDCSSCTSHHRKDLNEKLLLEELEAELLLQEESELGEYLMKLSQEESEYGKYLEELQEDYLICPLCCENKLVMSYGSDGVNQLYCSGNCSLSKKVPFGMVEIRKRLQSAMNAHSNCLASPGFTFTKEDLCLYLVCSDCGIIYFVL